MTKLVWDQGVRSYEAGVDRGVFYPKNGSGEVWNGLTSVQESPSDSEQTRYIDGVLTRTGRRPGDFSGTIEAFTYPQSFHDNVLAQRVQRGFGLSYRVMTGDTYQIHLVYNLLLGPTSYAYDQQTDIDPFSWEFTTLPVRIEGMKPSAHFIVESSDAYSTTIEAVEGIIYGSDEADARLPTPNEILEVFEEHSILQIIDHGDGTWTAIGPDDVISMLDPTTFQIDYETAVYLDATTYTIHSL